MINKVIQLLQKYRPQDKKIFRIDVLTSAQAELEKFIEQEMKKKD